MLRLVYIRPGIVEWHEVPELVLRGAAEALVRPIASSVCDLDLRILAGRTPFLGPFAFGHECVAEVLEVGAAVRGVHPGDRVVVPWHINCGGCDRCRAGLTAHCRTVPAGAMFGLPAGGDWGGLFDEVVRVPYADAMLHPLPHDIDPAAAVSAGDNLTLGLELLRGHLRRRPGARVLVLGGGGSVALYGAQLAAALGAGRVLYLDTDPARRAVAAGGGAETHAGPPVPSLGEFDVVFDSGFDAERLADSIALLAPEGVVESSGVYFERVELPLFRMYVQGVTFHTARANAGPHVAAVLDLIRGRRIDPARVVSETLPITDATTALAAPSLKPLFVRAPLGSARAAGTSARTA
ncbi:MAG: alcohol dehydrogenase [Pseudonocardiales bacterium]|nr:alcohol dehydrogenase [Pseudonocardiales bacterium]